MNIDTKYELGHVPWMTLTLFTAVWAIYLFTQWFGDPAAAREVYGIDFGNAFSYLTYAFIHADMYHITLNMLSLLIFGSVTEAQVGRRWYVPLVILGILGGSVCALALREFTGVDPGERVVGLSAATSALTIVGIGAIASNWGWGKGLSLATLLFLGLLLVTALTELWEAGLANITNASAAFCLTVCIGANWYSWRYRDGSPRMLTPVLWVVILLMADLLGGRMTYSAAGHLGGLLVGAALTFPALRRASPTEATAELRGGLYRCWSWTRDQVRRVTQKRWFAPTLLALSIFSLVAMLHVTDFWSTSPLTWFQAST